MKAIKFMTLMSIMIVALMIVACSDEPKNSHDEGEFVKTPVYEISMSEVQTRAANALSKNMTSKVYEMLEDEKTSENVCYSPLSMQMALSMFTHNCGESISKEVTDKYLDFFGVTSLYDLEGFNGMLLKELPKVDGRVKIMAANSLWENGDFGYFKDDASWLNSYMAEVFNVDFNDPSVVNKINGWTLDKTNKKIKLFEEETILTSLDMLYVNALYFIGKWSVPFEEGSGLMEFTDIEGRNIKVSKLYSDKRNRMKEYAQEKATITGNYQDHLFAKIPFGNGAFNMYAVLPQAGESVADCARFAVSNGLRLEEKGDVSHGSITLPEFETEQNVDGLQNIMEELGMPVVFKTNDGNPVSMDMKQKTFFKVTKDGAEGAGVSLVAISTGMPADEIDVVFNRPFIYYVMEESTGTVLFIGSVKKF